ncbi:MAG: GNAT family N-acetyltransferase [Flavobacteriales bacterium]
MPEIEIVRVTGKDLEQLKELSERTFTETFASMNTAANMGAYLAHEFATEKLERELADPDSGFYFALLEQQVVGYLKVNISSAQTELQDKHALEVERIYVLKEHHGKRIGQALLDKALAFARARGIDQVWLGVWEANAQAIHFYAKNGFARFGKHTFMLGADAQTDILMKVGLFSTAAGCDKDRIPS